MKDRITDLEIRLAHQEVALEEMNHALLTQHRLINTLQGELQRLQQQLRDIPSTAIPGPADEPPPPHY